MSRHGQQHTNPSPFWGRSPELKDSIQNHDTRSVSSNDGQQLLSLVSTLDPHNALILQLVHHPAVPLCSSGIV